MISPTSHPVTKTKRSVSLNPDISPSNTKATTAAPEKLCVASGGGGAGDDEFLMRLHSHSAKTGSCQEQEHRERYLVRTMEIKIILVNNPF